MPTIFCSLHSAGIGEEHFATAPTIERLLLLEYPFPFAEEAIRDSRIPEPVKSFLEEQLQRQVFSRILLIKNNSSSRDCIQIFGVNNRESDPFIRRRVIARYEELPGLDLESLYRREGGRPLEDSDASKDVGSTLFTEPMFLVCTNGKTDKCCSKFGLPIYHQLSARSPHTWQCSHVTGDRFAPNIVHLPYTDYYGRLVPEELDFFYDTVSRGRLYDPKYRGRSCYTPEEQAAGYFLRKIVSLYGARELQLVRTEQPEAGITESLFTVQGREKRYRVRVLTSLSEDDFMLNCQQKQGKIKLFTLRGVEAVTGP